MHSSQAFDTLSVQHDRSSTLGGHSVRPYRYYGTREWSRRWPRRIRVVRRSQRVCQPVVAWVTTRRPTIRSAVTARPTLLVHDGTILANTLSSQRVAIAEIHQSIRAAGIGDVDSVAAVVLETDGSISVIPAGKLGDGSALQDVDAYATQTASGEH
ncbi:YetF domain-containing protein [Gordonia sp. Z-3]|uniref:YetF domain-containing protein n=1 Tax=Gordonia sp. Z-3 TaxID=3115408 RepID=UPI002E2C244F|nr:YetF domain-containing protein [Gordonia sp. Z-3]MED5801829.1 YetF domain-containing protein [Gordonia sp. Z-3]